MASNEHRRQKKLAKKQLRAKEVRKLTVTNRNRSMRDILTETTRSGWDDCRIQERAGIFNIQALRRTSRGELIMAAFLVDAYCLGVKNINFNRDMDWEHYRQWVDGMPGNVRVVKPSYALKFILDAAEYGRSNGFVPHCDLDVALCMFADVDPTECTESFIFGKDGKPLYISGPFDDRAKVNIVISTLRDTVGIGNFEVITNLDQNAVMRYDGDVQNLAAPHFSEEDFDDEDADEYESDDAQTVNAISVSQAE